MYNHVFNKTLKYFDNGGGCGWGTSLPPAPLLCCPCSATNISCYSHLLPLLYPHPPSPWTRIGFILVSCILFSWFFCCILQISRFCESLQRLFVFRRFMCPRCLRWMSVRYLFQVCQVYRLCSRSIPKLLILMVFCNSCIEV